MGFFKNACLLSVLSLWACGSQSAAQLSSTAALLQVSAADMQTTYEQAARTPAYKQLVAKFSSSSFSAFAQRVRTTSKDEDLSINGLTLYGGAAQSAAAAKQLADMDHDFHSIGEFWSAIGLKTDEKVTYADFTAGLALIAKGTAAGGTGAAVDEQSKILIGKAVLVGLALQLPAAATGGSGLGLNDATAPHQRMCEPGEADGCLYPLTLGGIRVMAQTYHNSGTGVTTQVGSTVTTNGGFQTLQATFNRNGDTTGAVTNAAQNTVVTTTSTGCTQHDPNQPTICTAWSNNGQPVTQPLNQ